VLRVPGDKSVSHRLALLCALADGVSTLRGYLRAADCLHTLDAVRSLGAEAIWQDDVLRIVGVRGRFQPPARILDLGNSGTALRLLAGLLAAHPFESELTGDASLRSRPMRRIQEPLRRMGADVELLGPGGCAPVRIRGGRLKGLSHRLPVASAQVKSCLLLAGLFAEGETEVIEPQPTRNHTELLLRAMGADVRTEGLRIVVRGAGGGTPRLKADHWTVPGDFSSAAFWLAAAACREGSEVRLEGVGLNPRRTALLSVLQRMGAEVTTGLTGEAAGEPVGWVAVRGRPLRGTVVAGDEIPNLIDELPVVAVLGALASGDTLIRDAAELRVKESDRIAAMADGLRAMGIETEEYPDGMRVTGLGGSHPPPGGTVIDSRGDHRIAMAMAVLALCARKPTTLLNTWGVETSYPCFWDDLNALTGEGR
jgi:3-phosphoshikimate 1-carboxyvinyltransferase